MSLDNHSISSNSSRAWYDDTYPIGVFSRYQHTTRHVAVARYQNAFSLSLHCTKSKKQAGSTNIKPPPKTSTRNYLFFNGRLGVEASPDLRYLATHDARNTPVVYSQNCVHKCIVDLCTGDARSVEEDRQRLGRSREPCIWYGVKHWQYNNKQVLHIVVLYVSRVLTCRHQICSPFLLEKYSFPECLMEATPPCFTQLVGSALLSREQQHNVQ